ncbi:MAG: hypothetical protein GF409_01580 [Candidatus Omnitrophica bacterium]|nr:hypothetical protein [Candidatus Omnitrophota bacterium]
MDTHTRQMDTCRMHAPGQTGDIYRSYSFFTDILAKMRYFSIHMKPLIIILLVMICTFPAGNALAGQPQVRIYSNGAFFDKDHAEEEGLKLRRVESKWDVEDGPLGLKSWCYANAWIGGVHGSVRAFHYRGFRFDNIKDGTKFNTDIRFKVSLYGLINSTTYANAASHYKAKITAGILEGSFGNWDSPLAETVLWARTNKKSWKDWSDEVLWTTAGEIIGEAAGEAGGVAVGVVWDTASFALDALDVDEAIAQNVWVEFSGLPVEADKVYRCYVSLDSYVACVGVGVGSVNAYIDFYNHSPHFGDDNGRILSTRGLGVSEVSVNMPEGLPSIEEEQMPQPASEPEPLPPSVPSKPDLLFQYSTITPGSGKNIRVGESAGIYFNIYNLGGAEARNVRVNVREGERMVKTEMLDLIESGHDRTIHIPWNPERPGKYIFSAMADPDDSIEEENEANNTGILEAEVLGHRYDWSVNDISYLPLLPEEGEKISFLVDVANKGTMNVTSRLDLYVDNRKIKTLTVNTPPGKEETFGDGFPRGDSLQWNAVEGEHAVKVSVIGGNADEETSDNTLIRKIRVKPAPEKTVQPGSEEYYEKKQVEKRQQILREAREKAEQAETTAIEVTGFTGVDKALSLGQTREIGAYFKNVSGESLEDIHVQVKVENMDVRKYLAKYGAGGKRQVRPGIVNNGTFQLVFPYKAVYPGRFRVTAKAVVNDKGTENTVTKSAYFTVPAEGAELPSGYYRSKGADLAIFAEDLKIIPENPEVGDDVVARITVRNNGPVDIRNVEVLVTADQSEIDRRSLPLVKSGSSESFSFLENAREKGLFHVKVRVDPANKIQEVNEANNETATDVHVAGMEEQLEHGIKEKIKAAVKQKLAPVIEDLDETRRKAAHAVRDLKRTKKELEEKKKELKKMLGL